MANSQIVIIGHSPGKVDAAKSTTLKKVKDWMESCHILSYDWYNLVDYHAPDLKLKDATLKPETVKDYSVIISLGNLADDWCKRNNINNYKMPHPSGLNRIWNDKRRANKIIRELRKHIHANYTAI